MYTSCKYLSCVLHRTERDGSSKNTAYSSLVSLELVVDEMFYTSLIGTPEMKKLRAQMRMTSEVSTVQGSRLEVFSDQGVPIRGVHSSGRPD